MVPLRFVSTALGSNIQYDSKLKQITVVSVEGQQKSSTGSQSNGSNGQGSMKEFVEAGDLEQVKVLVEAGADVNEEFLNFVASDGTEYTISTVAIAAREGNFEVVKYLIDNGAAAKDSALKYSVRGNHVELARFLLEEGGDEALGETHY